jgi:hypothetical protein
MPAQAGIHDFSKLQPWTPWMVACVRHDGFAMSVGHCFGQLGDAQE